MINATADRAFDPQLPGTSESTWAQLFEGVAAWQPANGPLIVVSPHPDDEVLGAGGLMHSWAQRGHAVTVVSVTDGEAAYPGWHGLGDIRRNELKAALRHLSREHLTTLRLGIPDGRAADFKVTLRNSLLATIKPQVTLVAPYEFDGHPDHDAIGVVCRDLAQSHGVPLVQYPIWRWHHGDKRPLEQLTWGKFALNFEARRAKAHAVQCFTSQLRPRIADPIIPWHVLSYFERPYEAFIL